VNHSRAQELLSDFLERDLGEVERARLEAHVAGCAACGADLEGLRDTVALLRHLPAPEPPPFLATRVMARIAAGEARPASVWRRWLEALGTPAIAAPLAAAGAALVVWSFTQSPPGAVDVAETATGPERPPIVAQEVGRRPVFWAGAQPVALAGSLRGAGHPHSRSLAAHFEGPTEAVVAAWQGR
jgi:hypothetical protein